MARLSTIVSAQGFAANTLGSQQASNVNITGGIVSGANVTTSNAIITGGTITGITDLAIADGGTGAGDASSARTNLGLGTISTQNSNIVTITGGNITNTGLVVEAATAPANVLTLSYANATVFTHTATTNLTITPTNLPPQEGVMLLKLRNGGSVTVTYDGNVSYPSNTAPTLTSSGRDFLFIQGNATHYTVLTQLDV